MSDSAALVNLYIFLTATTVAGLGIAIYSIRFKDIFVAYREWIGFNLLATIGLLTLLAGNFYPSGLMSISANFFLALTHIYLWAFARKLMGRDFKFAVSFLILPFYLVVIGYFTYLDDNIYNRVLISSVLYFIFSLGTTCELLVPEGKEKYSFSFLVLILAAVLNCLKWCYYILTTPFIEKLTNSFFKIDNLALYEIGLLTAITEIMLIVAAVLIILEKLKRKKSLTDANSF